MSVRDQLYVPRGIEPRVFLFLEYRIVLQIRFPAAPLLRSLDNFDFNLDIRLKPM